MIIKDYVVIRDCSAGNETVGEMWQETKIFPAETPLAEVMAWATGDNLLPSKKHVQITIPD